MEPRLTRQQPRLRLEPPQRLFLDSQKIRPVGRQSEPFVASLMREQRDRLLEKRHLPLQIVHTPNDTPEDQWQEMPARSPG